MTAQASARGIPWWLRVLGAGVALLPLIAAGLLLNAGWHSEGVVAVIAVFVTGWIVHTAGLVLLPLLLPAVFWVAGARGWAVSGSLLLVLLGLLSSGALGLLLAGTLILNALPLALLLAVRTPKPDHPV